MIEKRNHVSALHMATSLSPYKGTERSFCVVHYCGPCSTVILTVTFPAFVI